MTIAQNEEERSRGPATERLIAWLTLLFGFAAGCAALAIQRHDWAAGLVIGAVLAWLNFRWLARGLDALVTASIAQADVDEETGTAVRLHQEDGGPESPPASRRKAQVPLSTYFTAMFRYGLIALCVYVSFSYLHLPLGSLLAGLCALGAAAIAASVYEILRPAN